MTNTTRKAGAHQPGGLPTPATHRVENIVQVVILLAVGVMAGAASFTHVHDWTMTNSPAGTPDWFGWANAVISELTPIAAGLDARRRARHGQPVTYPVILLTASVALSLAAQFAVAKPGITGWLLSAVPALAFMALVKLVISRAPATTPTTITHSGTEPGDAPSTEISWQTSTQRDYTPAMPAPGSDAAEHPSGDVPAGLVMSANLLAASHRQTTGQPIPVDTLADRLGVDTTTAHRLLTGTPGGDVSPPARINGHTPVGAVQP